MAIKRFFATKDNTITNAFKANLTTQGVSGNMGQSDVLEVFSIYAQANDSSVEKSRILIEFPMTDISSSREAGDIPKSGSVSFFLKMFNARHSQTTPKNFTLMVQAISKTWQEGLGLDMENYSDIDASNWLSSSDGSLWTSQGGDFHDELVSNTSQTFDTGFEDLEIDITQVAEQWINSDGNVLGNIANYGLGIFLTGTQEAGTTSYYTKKFFARGSQFFFKRPVIEARWDDSKADDRNNFYLSSSLLPAADNLMTLYLHNIVKGVPTNIPSVGKGNVFISIFSGSASTGPTGSALFLPASEGAVEKGHTSITGSWVETGIYSASFSYASSSITTIYDVWHDGVAPDGIATDATQFHTGSMITVKTYNAQDYSFDQDYVSNVTNMKDTYSRDETARFRLYVRPKNWSPNIYVKANDDTPNTIVENVYYKISRVSDNLDVVPYGTGSTNHTKLSYDTSGSYFDFDMAMLENDSVYALNFVFKVNGKFVKQAQEYRFRVE